MCFWVPNEHRPLLGLRLRSAFTDQDDWHPYGVEVGTRTVGFNDSGVYRASGLGVLLFAACISEQVARQGLLQRSQMCVRMLLLLVYLVYQKIVTPQTLF